MTSAALRQDDRMTGEAFDRWMETWTDLDRWELHDGHVIGMTGGTLVHSRLINNIGNALRHLRQKGCDEHRDTLLRSPANPDFRAFPDFFVRCGKMDERRTWIDDPVAVFEVLSKSTWRDDQGYKRDEYFKIAPLKHYVVVYQTEVRIELWSRGDDGEWPTAPVIVKGLVDNLRLSAFDLDIAMAEIYADTELAAANG